MKFKSLILSASIFILFVPLMLSAQQEVPVKFGELTQKDFNLPLSPIIDSNSQAVIIADIGSTEFKGNNHGALSYIYSRKTRIKILHQTALDDITTVKVLLRSLKSSKLNDELSDVECFTYNLENGKVVTTRLPINEIFEDRLNKRWVEKKFTMPGVKVGSIIEYSFKLTSHFYNRMQGWRFQHQRYPCLWSEYKVVVPAILGYSAVRRGEHPFFIDKTKDGWGRYLIKFLSEDAYESPMSFALASSTTERRWVIKDIPAFPKEEYLSASINFMDRIDFQLEQIHNENGIKMEKLTWAKLAQTLSEDLDFGYAVLPSQNEWLKKIVANLIADETNPLKKANIIYDYIVKNFTCIDHDDFYTSGLYELVKSKAGSVGDINLLLIAMLKIAEVNADPVILKTKDQGYTDPVFPVIDDLNYVICRSSINGKVYNLDASYPYLGFGNLPAKCYNGYARVINKLDTSGIYYLTDSIKEKKITVVTFTNDEKNKGSLIGNYQKLPGKLASHELRTTLVQSGENEYYKMIRTSYRDMFTVDKITIDSLRNGNEQLKINVDFKMKQDQDNDIIYFTPAMFSDSFRENPLVAANRKFPVEMEYPIDQMYVLNMEVPEGYEVDEMPKSTKVLFNNNEGYFQYQLAKSDNVIQLRLSIKLLKATFPASEYNDLREFFSFIVKKQNEQIVFKRKK